MNSKKCWKWNLIKLFMIWSSVSSAITVTSNENKVAKKERCKFYPSCTRGDRCEYNHPTTPCKAFPNCKYGDICLYIHPKCKFDLTCSRLDCNFTHTPIISAAPPLGKLKTTFNYFISLNFRIFFNDFFFHICL